MLNKHVQRLRDFKMAAAHDVLELEPKEEIELNPQPERREVVEIPQLTQITAHVERKILRLKPSDRNWLSVIKKIFAEGRRG